MVSEIKWCDTIHPTEIPMVNSSKKLFDIPDETITCGAYEEAKERYEEARDAYQMALEDLSQVHTVTEKARQTVIEARKAFLVVLENDKIEGEP